LDKRRFEAVEKVWTAVNDLAHLKTLSNLMSVLNFRAVAKEVNDPRMQQVLSVIGVAVPDVQKLKNVARDERPFLPELAWAYFAAYTTILYGSLMRYNVLRSGVDKADKMLSSVAAKTILKAALPHQTLFIEQNEPEAYHYLLEEIEGYLLTELRNILDGKGADQAAVVRAKEILYAVAESEEERARNAGAFVEGD
jgi:hypothetical protein